MRTQGIYRMISVSLFLLLIVFSIYLLDWDYIFQQAMVLIDHPLLLTLMTIGYTLAFILRALAWRSYIGPEHASFIPYLYAILYSLFINHLSPLKVGDVVRIGYLTQGKYLRIDEATHSVVVMRGLDLITLGTIAGIGAVFLGWSISWNYYWLYFLIGFIVIIGVFVGSKRFPFFHKHLRIVMDALRGIHGIKIGALIIVSWLLEAIVLYGVIKALSLDLGLLEAIWVNSMTVAGQVFHFTPGGIGTYESVMSISLWSTGIPWQHAYTVAVITHGFKFFYSYLVGFYLMLMAPISFRSIMHLVKRRGGIR